MSLDLIPMLLLSLLLMSAGGDLDTVELVLGGAHDATSQRGGLIVGDGQVIIPADAQVPGPVHVLGGQTHIRGTVDGDVAHIAGRLIIEDSARIGGTVQHLGGALEIAPSATVNRKTSVDLVPQERGLVGRFLPGLLLTGLLALIAARRARRRPHTLDHLSAALETHPVISLTVGALVAVTFLSLFVFMAFTIVLIPISLLGFAAGLVTLGYGVLALGAVVSRRLPIARAPAASAAGVATVMLAIQLLGAVPVIGNLAVGVLLLAGLGAVLLTYFGLQEFTPVRIQQPADIGHTSAGT